MRRAIGHALPGVLRTRLSAVSRESAAHCRISPPTLQRAAGKAPARTVLYTNYRQEKIPLTLHSALAGAEAEEVARRFGEIQIVPSHIRQPSGKANTRLELHAEMEGNSLHAILGPSVQSIDKIGLSFPVSEVIRVLFHVADRELLIERTNGDLLRIGLEGLPAGRPSETEAFVPISQFMEESPSGIAIAKPEQGEVSVRQGYYRDRNGGIVRKLRFDSAAIEAVGISPADLSKEGSDEKLHLIVDRETSQVSVRLGSSTNETITLCGLPFGLTRSMLLSGVPRDGQEDETWEAEVLQHSLFGMLTLWRVGSGKSLILEFDPSGHLTKVIEREAERSLADGMPLGQNRLVRPYDAVLRAFVRNVDRVNARGVTRSLVEHFAPPQLRVPPRPIVAADLAGLPLRFDNDLFEGNRTSFDILRDLEFRVATEAYVRGMQDLRSAARLSALFTYAPYYVSELTIGLRRQGEKLMPVVASGEDRVDYLLRTNASYFQTVAMFVNPVEIGTSRRRSPKANQPFEFTRLPDDFQVVSVHEVVSGENGSYTVIDIPGIEGWTTEMLTGRCESVLRFLWNFRGRSFFRLIERPQPGWGNAGLNDGRLIDHARQGAVFMHPSPNQMLSYRG